MDSLSLKIPLSTLLRFFHHIYQLGITWSFFFPPGTLYLIICVGFPRLSCSARTFWICVHLVSAGVCIWTQVSAMPHTHHCVPLPIPLGPCSMSWGVAMICVCVHMECVSLPLAPVDYSVFTASVWSWNCVHSITCTTNVVAPSSASHMPWKGPSSQPLQ